MKASLFRELVLYRYRYIVGYGTFGVLLIALLLVDMGNIPYGVSQSEMNSAIASHSLNLYQPKIDDIINLPYHVLQKLSIHFFGLSPVSITLPSTLLAIASGVLMSLMLHLWFRRNVAIIALIVSTVSVPFIAMGRTGTPAILYVFLLLVILYGAIRLTTAESKMFVWKLLVLIASVLLLYIPYGIYTVLVLATVAVFHPHIRYQMRHTRWWEALLLLAVGVVLVLPHIIAAVSAGGMAVLAQLLGLSTIFAHLAPDTLIANAISLVKTLFFFTKPDVSETITPFLNITFMLLAAFGLVKTIANRSMARSYLVIAWILFCIPMLLIDSSQLPLLFVPSVLLVAIGVETLSHEWYRLFPRNPYARIGALLPLSLLVFGLVAIAVTRYFYAYTYTDTRAIFHPELTTLRTVLSDKETQLVVPASHVKFYSILQKKHPKLVVTDQSAPAQPKRQRIVLASVETYPHKTPTMIVTSHYAKDGVLLRIYD